VAPFQTESCRTFFDHWHSLRQDGRLPHTKDFLDRAPSDLIPFAFIHEVESSGLLVRFMRTGLVQRWRHDLTGHYFGEHLDSDAREKLRGTMEYCVRTPCGMRQLGRIESSAGRALSFEAIVLPLAVDDGRSPRVTAFSQILDLIGAR